MSVKSSIQYLLHWRAVIRLTLTMGAIGIMTIAPAIAYAPPLRSQSIQSQSAAPIMERSSTAVSFTSIAAADEHTCSLTTGGGAICWGDNADGQVGDGTEFSYRPPVGVAGLASGVEAIAANGGHSCALLSSGGVSCWGGNRSGQLGDGSTSKRRVPVAVVGLSEPATAIAAGAGHTCALLQSGGVACWGRNMAGQLGNGTNVDQKTPVAVIGLAGGVSRVTAGANYTCALLQNGSVQCWGDNANGQLGDGSTVAQNMPVNVSGLAGAATGISAGSDHACAVLTDGTVQCWGDNARGQLGDGSREDRLNPVFVRDLRDTIATVAAGHFHTCALASDGDIHCWGTNNRGQLGNDTLDSSRTPVRVMGAPGDATTLAAGLDHACALFKTGMLYCWGSNRARQLGQGAPGVASVPRLIRPIALADQPAPINGISAIVGGRYHTCLITPSRAAQCWGRNSDGQLGDGTQLPHSQPVNVAGLASGVMALALGAEHTCALTQNGTLKCWGSNQVGQLGDGTRIEKVTPTDVLGLVGNVAAIVAGDSHSCALTQPGSVACWGANNAGQLGDGTTTAASFPVSVVGLSSDVIALTAGAEHTCALLQSGGIKCWGGNLSGQLGDGSQINRLIPVDVIGLGSSGMALDAGSAHTCALLSDGKLQCWGANNDAQLGDGSRMMQLQPVTVNGLPGPVTLAAAGVSHTCALLADKQVVCWGGNEYSQLGDGTAEDRTAPRTVSGLANNVLSLSAGGYHSCVLVTGNRPLCWGRDSDGQLATGALTQSSTLVALVESAPAQVIANDSTAQTGSVFTLIGSGFPYSSTLPLLVNATLITDTVQVNALGEFIFYLTTQGAENGAYTLQMGNPPSATVSFLLQDRAPLRPSEGGGVTIALPPGLGQPITDLYLPWVGR